MFTVGEEDSGKKSGGIVVAKEEMSRAIDEPTKPPAVASDV